MKIIQISLSGLAVISLLFVSCEKDLTNVADDASKGGNSGGGSTVVRYPLYIPVTVQPNGLVLTAGTGTTDLGGGKITPSWEYNGNMPGPTIVANSGTTASILFQNNLPEESITHWHGLVVDHPNDGHPILAVPSGSTYSYNFPIIQRASFNFYHPHPHMQTAKQVYFGLAGGFVIRDAEEAALDLPTGNFEVPLVLRDATLNKAGQLSYKPTAGGMFGTMPLVNGTRDPYLDVQRAVYRFRIVNGATSRIFNLNLSNNAPMVLIGNDGGFLPASSNQTALTISNGERLDILIDFRNIANGTKVMLRDTRSGWNLLEFRVTGNTTVPYSGALTVSSTVQPLPAHDTTRVFSFDGNGKINGIYYNLNTVNFRVPLGRTEQWRFVAGGSAPHPIHIHGASFQVVSRTGGRNQVFPWEAGWKDTVLLEDGETVTVKIRFDHYPGLYVMHCHKLEHEDAGMMANFIVF